MTNDELLEENNVFMFREKTYRWHSCCLEPSITMKCMEDGELFSFGASAPIKDEFVLIKSEAIDNLSLESLDEEVAKKVFGFSDEILSNSDLPPFEYSSSRTASAKVVDKVWLAEQEIRNKFNMYIRDKFSSSLHDDAAEFLLTITPDIICKAAIHAFKKKT